MFRFASILRRSGRWLCLGVALGLAQGCVHAAGPEVPPARAEGQRLEAAEHQAAEEAQKAALARQKAEAQQARAEAEAQKVAAQKARKDAALADAQAKQVAADEAKQRALAEKQAADQTRQAESDRIQAEKEKARAEVLAAKADEQKVREEAALTAAKAKEAAAAERTRQRDKERKAAEKAKQRALAEKQAADQARQAESERIQAEKEIVRAQAMAAKAAERKAREEAAQAAAKAKEAAAADLARQREQEHQAAEEAKQQALAAKQVEVRLSPEALAIPAAPSDYVLRAGDEIDIQVYREPELSGTFKIDPSGDIRHSLAGTIPLAGKTISAAESYFTKRLAKDYLVNPRVIIKMVSTQSSQIVVLGAVKNPGVYPLPVGDSMTLLQAIAGAGGFNELASPERVRIVRKTPDGGQTTLRVRVASLLAGKGRQQDVSLEPNDVIMVPEVVF